MRLRSDKDLCGMWQQTKRRDKKEAEAKDMIKA